MNLFMFHQIIVTSNGNSAIAITILPADRDEMKQFPVHYFAST